VNEVRELLKKTVPLHTLLGYLNFSEGKHDPRFARQNSDCYKVLSEHGRVELWKELAAILDAELLDLHEGGGSAFKNVDQARGVLKLVFSVLLPAYRKHHADLLSHLTDAELFQPFFTTRAFEAVLAQRGPWSETQRISDGALKQLNDYVGHRPIAILESRPRGEPYDHERVRPIPLYINGAGIGWGRYQELLEKTLEILRGTDPGILQDAYFDPALLDELALDPRGYDFGHPADKRPNYVFGEWDPHLVDNQGRFRRFVIRHIVIEALWQRVQAPGDLDRDEVLWEAAAVLAGTILMAAGISGAGPETHDSSTTLSTLIPRIARYREAFYANLLKGLTGKHGERLREETSLTRQPFGGARQHLNQTLARHRALQLQQRHLAMLFAIMGYPQASRRQAAAISVASVRFLTEIHLRLASGRLFVERGEPQKAADLLAEIEDLLRRGIDCGALVDPWNILGFQAQYPRVTALEDSVRDHRCDELIGIVDGLLNLNAQVLSEGAAGGGLTVSAALAKNMKKLADWWDRFATVEVHDVAHVHGGSAATSAKHVSQALEHWRRGGSAAADLGFWKRHLDNFRSSSAFALVIDTLLRKQDYQAAMALLMTWLSQLEQVPLEEGEHSFHALALRWMLGVCGPEGKKLELVPKFFDYLESNAESYWNVPRPEVTGAVEPGGQKPAEAEEDVYSAAYENVTYQDSTGDDVEGEVLDIMPQKDFDLTAVAEPLERQVRFLATVARLWNIAARKARLVKESTPIQGRLEDWLARAQVNQKGLLELLDAIHEHAIPKPTGSHESLVEFDRRRLLKERLLSVILAACLDTGLAVGALQGTVPEASRERERSEQSWEPLLIQLEQAFYRGDVVQARALVPSFLAAYQGEPLLFTPLAHDGDPRLILRASMAQTLLHALVANLPRLGLIRETYLVLQTAFAMEKQQPSTGPRVTSFDRLFQAACHATVEAVLDAADQSATETKDEDEAERIATLLETIIEPFLALWIEHSKTMRIAVLEQMTEEAAWDKLRDFIGRYGKDLFQQRFMTLANLRGILNQGVGVFLDYLAANPDPLHPVRLIEKLDQKIPRQEAERILELIMQTIVENYEEYRDYNATTTQSDYGDNLHQLFDFLQIKASYERNAWQLKPLVLVHEILARRQSPAAAFWRKQVQELTRELADEHLEELAELQETHAMRLPTLADRVAERFVQPMEIDRLVALIEPAMDQARQLADHTALEEEVKPLAAEPSGAGLDVPLWLRRLLAEVQRVQNARSDLARLAENWIPIPKVKVSLEELRKQFEGWNQSEQK
jgi:hypothetical protein